MAHSWIAELKRRITQTVTKGIERFAAEIPIGSVCHRVVIKRRKLGDTLVESYRKPPRRTEVACQSFGDSGSSSLTWVPSLENRGYVFVSPIDGERAAIG